MYEEDYIYNLTYKDSPFDISKINLVQNFDILFIRQRSEIHIQSSHVWFFLLYKKGVKCINV